MTNVTPQADRAAARNARGRAPGRAPPPPGRPIFWHLALFGAALAATVLALAAGLGWTYLTGERARLHRMAGETAATAAAALDRDLGGLVDAIGVLSLAPSLQDGDLPHFDGLARGVRDMLGVNVVLRDVEGTQLVNTRLPRGAPLPRIGALDSDRTVLATGRPDVSNVITGAVARAPLFMVNVPVRRDGEIAYLLNLSTPLERVRDTVARAGLAPGWTVEVADRNGVLVAALPRSTTGAGQPLPPELLARATGPAGSWAGSIGDASEAVIAWRRTEVGDWLVLASAPNATLHGLMQRVAAAAVLLAILLGLLVTGLGWSFARRIAAPIERLAAIAAAPAGAGGSPGPAPGPVREVNTLAAALHAASADLRAREAELARVLETTSDGVFALAPDWRVTFMNRRAMDLIAGGRDVTGQVLWDAFPEAVGGRFWKAYTRCMEERAPTEAEEFYAPLGRLYAARAFPAEGGGISVFFRDVTTERAAADRLAASEARLRAILDNVPVGVVLVEAPSGRVLVGNRRVEEIMRHSVLPSPDIAAYRDWEGYHPDGRRVESHDYPGARALAGEDAPSLVLHYLRGDGSLAWLRINGAPIRDSAGTITGAVVAISDIDAERRAAEALAESEARLRLAAERVQLALEAGAIIGTWDWDLQADRITADDRFALSFGLDPERCHAGLGSEEVVASIHPDDLARVRRTLDEAIARGGPYSCEYRVRRQDGTYRWIEANGRVTHAPDGTPARFPGVLLDVEARRATEAERDRAATLLRTFIEAVPGVVYAKDRDGRFLIANEGTARLIGKPPEAFLGRTDADVLDDPQQAAAVMANDRRIMEGGRTEQVEEEVSLPDGTPAVWLSTKAPLRDGTGRVIGLIGASVDITGRKHAETVLARSREELERLVEARTRELRESEARLAQAAKMESLGRLAGGIAHDFNNVLQAVQGGVSLAAKRMGRDPAGARHFLELAADATERGVAVTGRLLAFARRGELTAAPVQAEALLHGLAEMLRHTMGPTVAVRVEVAPDVPAMMADAGQLEAVLVNLANNARDALRDGRGTIRLSAVPAAAPGPGVPPQLRAGGYLRLDVVDDGEGMAPEVLARVTEPFFTTKPRGKGTGLGLAMARGFAEQSGGALSIDSAPGRGTTVSLWLPRAAEAAEAADAGAAGQPAPVAAAPAGAAVLLVDDEPAVRSVLSATLADAGHGVEEAPDAAAALALIDAGRPVEVLVTDLSMPGGMDGLALLRAARSRLPGLPAVLVTGHAGDAIGDALRTAAADGPFALLHKPASPEAVRAQVAALLAERRGAASPPPG
ncbi:PAS domain-containing protein [Falsiroseomonas sp. CW058]|uniref:PAS domain-containing protein n=1 Tax=Falsiroseomonas sp. CW058 TaxID=3388664 RepID=UPI003D314893